MTKRRPASFESVGRAWALGLGLCLAVPAHADTAFLKELLHVVDGTASYYGGKFNGRRTASGERFDKQQFTGASNRFPLGSMVAVRRIDNGRCALVRVNDRMHRRHSMRVIDVSKNVARQLGMLQAGVIRVQVARLGDDWQQAGDAACEQAFSKPAENCELCGQLPAAAENHPLIIDP